MTFQTKYNFLSINYLTREEAIIIGTLIIYTDTIKYIIVKPIVSWLL